MNFEWVNCAGHVPDHTVSTALDGVQGNGYFELAGDFLGTCAFFVSFPGTFRCEMIRFLNSRWKLGQS